MPNTGKRIWLVRHAESEAQTGEFMGIDAPLSRLGTLQAEQLKQPLSGIKFDVVYISPLKRARQTYEYSGLNLENVCFDSRLIEEMPPSSYSVLLPYEQLPAYGKADIHNAWNLDTRERANSFISDILSTTAEKILIISHSAFINILLQKLIKIQHQDNEIYFGTNNCGISSVILPSKEAPRTTILFWNDISHVRNLLGYDPIK